MSQSLKRSVVRMIKRDRARNGTKFLTQRYANGAAKNKTESGVHTRRCRCEKFLARISLHPQREFGNLFSTNHQSFHNFIRFNNALYNPIKILHDKQI